MAGKVIEFGGVIGQIVADLSETGLADSVKGNFGKIFNYAWAKVHSSFNVARVIDGGSFDLLSEERQRKRVYEIFSSHTERDLAVARTWLEDTYRSFHINKGGGGWENYLRAYHSLGVVIKDEKLAGIYFPDIASTTSPLPTMVEKVTDTTPRGQMLENTSLQLSVARSLGILEQTEVWVDFFCRDNIRRVSPGNWAIFAGLEKVEGVIPGMQSAISHGSESRILFGGVPSYYSKIPTNYPDIFGTVRIMSPIGRLNVSPGWLLTEGLTSLSLGLKIPTETFFQSVLTNTQ